MSAIPPFPDLQLPPDLVAAIVAIAAQSAAAAAEKAVREALKAEAAKAAAATKAASSGFYTLTQALERLHVSKTSYYENPQLLPPPIKRGRKLLFSVDEVEQYRERLLADRSGPAPKPRRRRI